MSIDFPKLAYGQCAVAFIEVNTAIVLDLELNRFIGEGQAWSIFDSFEEAKGLAQRAVASNPSVECGIKDWSGWYVVIVSR